MSDVGAPLSDTQVRRYARHILLREVGGRGQQRLLSTPVRLMGEGPGLAIAAAYLAAGGTPLISQSPLGGFLHGSSLGEFNPDSVARSPQVVCLASAPSLGEGSRRVVVGANGVTALSGGCPDCFAVNVSRLDPDAASVDGGTLSGALAALVVQRMVLFGETPELAAVRVAPRVELLPPLRCAAHL